MTYVYAVAPAATPPVHARGLRGEPLVVIRAGTVAAVAGDLSRPPAAVPRNLRAHHRVVASIAGEIPALLPARFGMLLPEPALRLLLESREATFRRALRRVRGRVQMTVRFPSLPVGRGSRSSLAAPSVGRGSRSSPGAPSVGRGSRSSPGMSPSGTSWLRARARDASRPSRRPESVRLRAAVRRWVRGEEVSEQAGVLSIYHLVPRSAAAAYRRAVLDAVGAECAFTIGGPYPPFAFVPDLLSGEA